MHPWTKPAFDALLRGAERLPHALLIHGTRGVGKLALAEHIAQALLCEQPAKRPCGACEGCRWFSAGNHPDFRRVEPEVLWKEPPNLADEEEGGGSKSRTTKPSLQIKIDQVRDLADFLNLRSHRGGRRIALLHPAEDMNENSANALLKALEEPPGSAMFILVSHRPARLLPTVRSRCFALPVAVPKREVAVRWLEGQGVKDAGRWLAFAGGAPLRAAQYAAEAARWEGLIRSPAPVNTREELGPLVEVLQKAALDQALAAFGLPPRYGTNPKGNAGSHRAWLTYARRMGQEGLLVDHPVSPKLFSAELLGAKPR